MNLKKFIFVAAMPIVISAMVQPPIPLPNEIKKHIIPFIASSNVPEVAETIRALNATNRFFHAAIQAEQTMLELLDRMPYTANAIRLLKKLHKMPITKHPKIEAWHTQAEERLKYEEVLFTMVDSDDHKTLEELLSDKDVHLDWLSPFHYRGGYGSQTALLRATQKKNKKMIARLLQAGADPDLQGDRDGYSALLTACSNQDEDIVKMLLNAKANPALPSTGFNTSWPLSVAVLYKNMGIISSLLDAGLTFKKDDYYRRNYWYEAFLFVATQDCSEVLRKFLQTGISPDHSSLQEKTAISAAAEANLIKNVEILLKAGANPNCIHGLEPGAPALYYAAHSHNLPMIRLLISYNASPHLAASTGYTSLDLAKARGYYRIMALFAAHDATRYCTLM